MRPLRALLVNDASLSGHHGSALVTEQAVRLSRAAGIELAHGWDWNAVEAALPPQGRTGPPDLVIVNGEGSIHHDAKAAVRIARLAARLKDAGIPAYLVNASVEGNGREVMEGLAAFRLCFVRDEASSRALARAGIASEVVPDLTLSLEQAPRARCSGALLITDASNAARTAFLVTLARERPGARALTLRSEPPWPRRGSPGRRLAFEAKRLASLPLPLGPWSLRYAGALRTRAALLERLTREASAIVCGRYHAVCFALLTRLPFLAVAGNTTKVAALLSDAGLSDRHRTLDELVEADLTEAVVPFSAEEETRIATFLADARRLSAAMFARIRYDALERPDLVRSRRGREPANLT